MADQGDLFTYVPPRKAFGGATYDPDRDYVRLHRQLRKVYEVMKDGQWHSLQELVTICGGTAASISARVRDFRKRQYGSRQVDRKHVKDGLFLYRLVKGYREVDTIEESTTEKVA